MSSLAAARADNFYYPPDWRPEMGSISKFQGSKGKNQYEQYGIIRFELPFDGWCLSCHQHLAKGLRFNAKKEKDGKYFSTQIYSFHMKCFKCSNAITIKTDPKNDTYDYCEGIRKMEHDYQVGEDDHVLVVDDGQGGGGLESQSRESLTLDEKNNPILRLQNDLENRVKVLSAQERMNKLIDLQEKQHHNDYDSNSLLRKINRDKKRKSQHQLDEGRKAGFENLPLLDHIDQDRIKAKMVKYSNTESQPKLKSQINRASIMNQSIFLSSSSADADKPRQSKEVARIRRSQNSVIQGIEKRISSSDFNIDPSIDNKSSNLSSSFIIKSKR